MRLREKFGVEARGLDGLLGYLLLEMDMFLKVVEAGGEAVYLYTCVLPAGGYRVTAIFTESGL